MIITIVLIFTILNGFISANRYTDLALLSYKQFAALDDTNNILLSPFSTEIVLSLAYYGAKGDTAEELQDKLGAPVMATDFRSIRKEIEDAGSFSLITSSKLFINDGFEINKKFETFAQRYYKAELDNIDLSDTVGATETINEWIQNQTDNKITILAEDGDIDDKSVVFFANALRFKGDWLIGFDERNTKLEVFDTNNNGIITVLMMNTYKRLALYYEDEELDAKFLQISLDDENVAMVIALPNNQSFATLEKNLDKVFKADKFKIQRVDIALPKLKFETSVNITQILENMSIKNAFQPEVADFSGIAGNKGDLYIQEVRYKTFIDLNEGGMESNGSSVIEFPPESGTLNFIANHPFIFYIKYKNIILYAGRIINPPQF